MTKRNKSERKWMASKSVWRQNKLYLGFDFFKNPSHFWRFLISKKVSFDDRSFAYIALHCQIGSITFDEQNVWRQKAKSSNEKTTQNNYLFFYEAKKFLVLNSIQWQTVDKCKNNEEVCSLVMANFSARNIWGHRRWMLVRTLSKQR